MKRYIKSNSIVGSVNGNPNGHTKHINSILENNCDVFTDTYSDGVIDYQFDDMIFYHEKESAQHAGYSSITIYYAAHFDAEEYTPYKHTRGWRYQDTPTNRSSYGCPMISFTLLIPTDMVSDAELDDVEEVLFGVANMFHNDFVDASKELEKVNVLNNGKIDEGKVDAMIESHLKQNRRSILRSLRYFEKKK